MLEQKLLTLDACGSLHEVIVHKWFLRDLIVVMQLPDYASTTIMDLQHYILLRYLIAIIQLLITMQLQYMSAQ